MRAYTTGCGWVLSIALAWSATLGTALAAGPDLAALARAAKQQFRAPVAADLEKAKLPAVAAAERLQQRFDDAGPSADDWKAFLGWEKFRRALSAPGVPDKTVLLKTYGRLISGHDGLGLVWFVDLRQALESYLNVANALELKDLKVRYAASMEALAKRLESYEKAPTADDARWIGDVVRWLDDIGQASDAVRGVRAKLRQSNIHAELSAKLVDAAISEPVDETEPVSDCILGTSIRGDARMTGRLHAELVPDPESAVFDTIWFGTAESDNVGFNGPATIWSNGNTQISMAKRLWFNAQGWSTHPAVTNATTSTEITGLAVRNNSKLIEKLAWKQVWKKKCQAEQVASLHAEWRVNERIDARAEKQLAENNENFQKKFRKPLEDRKVFPERLQLSTVSEAVRIQALEAAATQLAAPANPPAAPTGCDLTIRIHESLVNNAARSVLGGMIVREENLRENVKELTGKVPEALQPNQEKEPWGITFAGVPVTVTFGDNQIQFTMRAMGFAQGERDYPGMNLVANYKLYNDAKGCRAVRQGPLEIDPPDKALRKGGGLRNDEIAIRTLLAKRWEKILKPEMPLEPLKLEGPLAKIGELAPATWNSRAGWLSIGYKVAPATAAPAKPTPAKVAAR